MDAQSELLLTQQSDETDFRRALERLLARRYQFVGPVVVLPEVDIKLTPREQECLLMVAKGCSYPDIAQFLGISRSTVKFHLGNARQKLDAVNTAEAMARAVVLGLIVP